MEEEEEQVLAKIMNSTLGLTNGRFYQMSNPVVESTSLWVYKPEVKSCLVHVLAVILRKLINLSELPFVHDKMEIVISLL